MAQNFRAVLKKIRMTPRKARLVVDLVRGKPVQEALDVLSLTEKRAALPIRKLLKSAIANATSQASIDVDRLIVSEAFVNAGPVLHRWIPRAQGRATPLKRRMSHITIGVQEK